MEVFVRVFSLSLLIGFIAALIDVTPMIIRKLDASFVASAFFTWLFLGIVIHYSKLLPQPWLNGIAIALMFVIPIVCLAAKLDRAAVPIMLVTSVVLGAGIGFFSALLVN
jgi:hypothetical protein